MLDPEARRLLDKMQEREVPPYQQIGVAAARAQVDDGPAPGHHAEVGSVEDLAIAGPAGAVPIRIYRPAQPHCPASLLFLHGGGWTIGSIKSHDHLCRRLCAAAGCSVVAVDYRLAPEHPFPAGLMDCDAVVGWMRAHGDRLGGAGGAIILAGDSAGGNLAAALALLARDRGEPIALQLLLYPSLQVGADTASMARNAEGFGLSRAMMDWFADQYCPPAQRDDPLASPLCAPELAGLAPALIIVAGHDPLHDEGVAYAQRLIEAGVRTTLSAYPGQIHGFVAMTRFLADGRRGQAEIVDAIWRETRADERWGKRAFGEAPES